MKLLRFPVPASPAFRRFWPAMLLSRIGDTFTIVALLWFVLELSGPAAAGLVLAFFGVPALVAGPIAGRLLDRHQPRALMAVENFGRAGLILLIPVLHWSDLLEIWHICLIAFCSGVLSPISEVGENTLIPELVHDRDLEKANSLLSANWEISTLIGPIAAGLIIDAFGAPVALLVDTLTFMLMGAAMLTMPQLHRPGATSPADHKSAFRETMEGFTLLVKMRVVGFLTLLSLGVLLLDAVKDVLVPVYGREVLNTGASGYGLLLSTLGMGSLLGLLVLGPLVRRISPGAALAGSLILGGLTFAPLAMVNSLPTSLAVGFVAGFTIAPVFVVNRSTTQRLVPDQLRGRIFGASSSLGAAGYPLGSAVGGFMLAALSPGAVILLVSVLSILFGLAALLVPNLRKKAHRMNQPEISA